MAFACSGVISCVPRKKVLAYSLVTSPHLQCQQQQQQQGQIGGSAGHLGGEGAVQSGCPTGARRCQRQRLRRRRGRAVQRAGQGAGCTGRAGWDKLQPRVLHEPALLAHCCCAPLVGLRQLWPLPRAAAAAGGGGCGPAPLVPLLVQRYLRPHRRLLHFFAHGHAAGPGSQRGGSGGGGGRGRCCQSASRGHPLAARTICRRPRDVAGRAGADCPSCEATSHGAACHKVTQWRLDPLNLLWSAAKSNVRGSKGNGPSALGGDRKFSSPLPAAATSFR